MDHAVTCISIAHLNHCRALLCFQKFHLPTPANVTDQPTNNRQFCYLKNECGATSPKSSISVKLRGVQSQSCQHFKMNKRNPVIGARTVEAPKAMRLPTRGSGGAYAAPPAGSGAEPRPKSNLVHSRAAKKPLVAIILNILKSMFYTKMLRLRCTVTNITMNWILY